MIRLGKYHEAELIALRDRAKKMCLQTEDIVLKEVLKIALIEINWELDERRIRKEGRNG